MQPAPKEYAAPVYEENFWDASLLTIPKDLLRHMILDRLPVYVLLICSAVCKQLSKEAKSALQRARAVSVAAMRSAVGPEDDDCVPSYCHPQLEALFSAVESAPAACLEWMDMNLDFPILYSENGLRDACIRVAARSGNMPFFERARVQHGDRWFLAKRGYICEAAAETGQLRLIQWIAFPVKQYSQDAVIISAGIYVQRDILVTILRAIQINAARSGHRELIDWMFEMLLLVGSVEYRRDTFLYNACACRTTTFSVQAALKRWDYSSFSFDLYKCLHEVAAGGSVDNIEVVIKWLAARDPGNQSPKCVLDHGKSEAILKQAVLYGNVHFLRWFKDHLLDSKGCFKTTLVLSREPRIIFGPLARTLIEYALENDYLEVLQWLMANGARSQWNAKDFFEYAVCNNSMRVMDWVAKESGLCYASVIDTRKGEFQNAVFDPDTIRVRLHDQTIRWLVTHGMLSEKETQKGHWAEFNPSRRSDCIKRWIATRAVASGCYHAREEIDRLRDEVDFE